MVEKTKTENDDDNGACPPGMKKDADGKCVAAENFKPEEDNAGDSSSKGAGTNTDASTVTEPAGNKECPPGTTLNSDGDCRSTGDPAGQTGGGGTGNPETPGKEAANEQYYKMIERLMASHSEYNAKLLESMKDWNTKQLESFVSGIGGNKVSKEAAAFGVKTELFSSKVNDSGKDSVYDRTVGQPAAFFEQAKKGIAQEGYKQWAINPEAYYNSLKHGWMNYGSGSAHGKMETDMKGEAFTITGGDMPQIFSKQVYLVPGGRMRVPIRQFLDTQIIEDADRFNWYTVNGFAFDDTTSEGSAPTQEAQTITKVTATPSLVRAYMVANYADIENAPFDLIEAFNRAAALGALDAEATDVLDTVYDAITPTNWVESDGTVITEDDTTAPGTMQQEAIYVGMQLIQDQGGDTSPGNMVAFLHPKPLRELILDVTTEFWAGMGAGGASPRLMNTAMGVIENRLGVDIVATNQVAAQDNTTNDTYRNVLAMKGSIGLAVAAELQIEAQRRPDLSAVTIGARHRIKGAVIDETMTARMSSAQ